MTLQEFNTKYEITWGPAKTLFPGTVKVQFNKREAILKDRETGHETNTGIYADVGSEDFMETIVIERFVKPIPRKDTPG